MQKAEGSSPGFLLFYWLKKCVAGYASENKYCISAPITSLSISTSAHDARPVPAFTQGDKVIPPPEPKPTPMGVETASAAPNSTPPTEIDFETLQPNDSPAIGAPKESPRDNPTHTPTPSQNATSITASAPQMGDTRTVDGQPQVYFLGFGWIEDNDTPNVGIYADDMYENDNKIGYMGGGEFVDGEGDINKMVGIMD